MRAIVTIHQALGDFAEAVTAKMTQLTAGEPEDQLRGPFDNFMTAAARALGWNVVCTGETPLPGRLGRPDYAVHRNGLLAGYVELKAPGVGATYSRFRGHNRDQWKRFTAIPNILYTDGNEWALYRDGELEDKLVRLSGDVAADGRKAATTQDATALERLLQNFILQFAYRSFDRQLIFADARLLDRPGPGLWRTHGERQVYLTSLLNHPLGQGPAVTATALIPDLHHFRGSYGAKEVFPLYRDADATEANALPGLLDLLGAAYKHTVTPEDFLAYVYSALAQPAFTARYAKELETRELRVPLTKDAALFEQVRAAGARLLWLHTYGERYVPKGQRSGHVPRGAAKCVKAVPGDPDGYPESFDYNDATRAIRVGEGEFRPVAREVFEFEVSGLKVVQSWLKYRMKKGAGKKSSPLDDIRPERWSSQFTTELLELLSVLEATVAGYPEQAKLLEAVAAGPCFQADEIPPVSSAMRRPPQARTLGRDLFEDL